MHGGHTHGAEGRADLAGRPGILQADVPSSPATCAGSIFGVNDWNYAYGKNTAKGILRDADLIALLAPAGNARPQVVIDDGWQDPTRFPSMSDLASQIRNRNLHPGRWIRPLRPDKNVDSSWLLPEQSFW